MKIIRVSNFDLEDYAQSVAAQWVNPTEGEIMCKALCATCDNHSSTWYQLVPDDYVLWRGMAEFVDLDDGR